MYSPPMKAREKRAAGLRMRGRYSSRLSDKRGQRHKTFRTSPEFFRLAVESLVDYALVTMDADRLISSWSGPAAAMLGWSESEMIGQSIARIFTPEDIEKGVDRSEFQAALDKGRESDERWHVRKDGTRLWCYGLSFPLRDENGEFRGFAKLIRDDSARKGKDDLLREQEERLRLAAESTGLGTFDYDVETRSLHLSARAAELFGLGRDRKTFGFGDFVAKVDAADRERVMAVFDRCVKAATGRDADVEYRVTMPRGPARWVSTLIRAFCDRGREEGMPAKRLLGTVMDITDKREREERTRALNRELEARVKLRTAELTALNKELESFAYSASHDLRAPLRKIAAFSQAILQSGESVLGEKDRTHFERIRAATSKMHQLIDATLALSLVTRKPLELADCDLSGMAREIAGDLRAADPARRAEFVIAEGLRAGGDCDLLALVLRNLLDNAWKFTSRHPEARIEFGARTIEGRRVYFVKDDGAGFDMRYAHKLFGAFRRLHGESEFPGSGIGLGLAERAVKRHRGRIWAESQVEKGAAFYFTLGTESQ